MAQYFSSVDWLSQSCSKNDREETNRDQTSTFFPWTPLMSAASNIGHMAPNPENQGLMYPGFNHLSSDLWNNEKPTYCEVPFHTADDQKFSPSKELYQMDKEVSHNSRSNGECNKSENLNGTSGNSNISQEIMSSTEESSTSQGEQSKLKENFESGNNGNGGPNERDGKCEQQVKDVSGGCITNTNNNDPGYDSEISQSTTDSSEGGQFELSGETSDKQNRRLRTAFTSEQITVLEDTFQKHRYLGVSERHKTAKKLNLSEAQVKTWFQNRRMKFKREMLERKTIHFQQSQLYQMYGYPTISPYQHMHPAYPYYIPHSMPYSYSMPSASYDNIPRDLRFPPNNQEEYSLLRL